MSQEPSNINWRPNADIKTLKLRAEIISKIRYFFKKNEVLEIDTPVMAHAPVTDPYLQALEITPEYNSQKKLYLQTSPEYAMKRLLAAGSGCIYQICKAFRDEPSGPQHNIEFTMLEWYRVGFNYINLIQEIMDLLNQISSWPKAQIKSYQEIFEEFFNINPHIILKKDLIEIAKKNNCYPIIGLDKPTKDDLLMLLFSKKIEPKFANDNPIFIIDYPASQAALANTKIINSKNYKYKIALRFELYYKGIELANGYDELISPEILLNRFENDLKNREEQNLPKVPIDYKLLEAMQNNQMPKCSGVALGLDRLIALILNKKQISQVITF